MEALKHLQSKLSALPSSRWPSLASIFSDRETITLDGVSFPAHAKQNLVLDNNKVLTYSLASLVALFILGDPSATPYVQFRKACIDQGVEDPVKLLDRNPIWDFFFARNVDRRPVDSQASKGHEGSSNLQERRQEEDDDRMDMSEDEEDERSKNAKISQKKLDDEKERGRESVATTDDEKKRKEREEKDSTKKSDKHNKHHKDHSSSFKHASSDDKKSSRHEDKRPKKSKGPITQEDIVKNLSTVVDKREVIAADTKSKHVTAVNRHETNHHDKNLKNDDSNYRFPAPMVHANDDEHDAIIASLSSEGYEVDSIPKLILEKDRLEVEKIMSLEIPVGNSSSILQCGVGLSNLLNNDGVAPTGAHSTQKRSLFQSDPSNKKKDFSMVLDIYNELMKSEEKEKRVADKRQPTIPTKTVISQQPKQVMTSVNHAAAPHAKARVMAQGKPIIVVPNAMTSPITLINAASFFEKSTFIPREVMLKQTSGGRKPSGSVNISRRISPRLGGGTVEYEIVDNPTMKLTKDDWDRVVAVIAQGASWQFKGWKMKSSNSSSATDTSAVDVFSRCFGFYIGFESSPVPQELLGWNVKRGMLSRDKRGLDSVVVASFWNGLDEWMSVHKPEYLPQEEF